jgi:hypothetical protein
MNRIKDLLEKGSRAVKYIHRSQQITRAKQTVNAIASSPKWGDLLDQSKRILKAADEYLTREKDNLRLSYSSNQNHLSQFNINSRSFKEAVTDFYWRFRSLHLIETVKIIVNRYIDSKRAQDDRMLPHYHQGVNQTDHIISTKENTHSIARSAYEFAAIFRHSTKTAFANWQNPDDQVFVYDSNFRLRRTDVDFFGKQKDKKFDDFVAKYFARNFVFGKGTPKNSPISFYWRFTLTCGLIVFVYTYFKYYFKGRNDHRHVQEFLQLEQLLASQLKPM